MAGKIRRKPATMYLNKESNSQYLNYSTESCSKKERKQIYVGSSFYYRIWIYTSQYFNALTSVQPTCIVLLCNFYNFSFVLLQCRLLALYLENKQNINYLSRNNILGMNLWNLFISYTEMLAGNIHSAIRGSNMNPANGTPSVNSTNPSKHMLLLQHPLIC